MFRNVLLSLLSNPSVALSLLIGQSSSYGKTAFYSLNVFSSFLTVCLSDPEAHLGVAECGAGSAARRHPGQHDAARHGPSRLPRGPVHDGVLQPAAAARDDRPRVRPRQPRHHRM